MKEGPSVAIIQAINGPGMCGADTRLGLVLVAPEIPGFVAEPLRPPGAVAGAAPTAPENSPVPSPAPPYWSNRAKPRSLIRNRQPVAAVTRQFGRPEPGVDGHPAAVAPRRRPPARWYRRSIFCQRSGAAGSLAVVRPAGRGTPSDFVLFVRGMNGDPNANISEHAFGNALDMAAFTLADGHKITVKDGWHGTPEEQGFLHDVQGAACDRFSTVLAPGSNAYHEDHIHVDLMRHASGRVMCQPAAIPGGRASPGGIAVESGDARAALGSAARRY